MVFIYCTNVLVKNLVTLEYQNRLILLRVYQCDTLCLTQFGSLVQSNLNAATIKS